MDGGELIVVVLAIAAGALVKSVSGMGLPIIAVPLISLVAPLEQAVVVTVLAGVATNASISWQERRHRGEARDLPVLAVTGVLGAVVGTLLLVHLPEDPVLAGLALVVISYVIVALAHPELHVDPVTSRRWAPAVGLGAGLLQGATGASGPVTGTWIHAQRLPRDAHVLAVSILFLMAGVGQLVSLLASGAFAGNWTASLLGIPVALAAIPLGTRVRGRLSGRGFDLVVLATLTVAAVTLLVRLVL